MTEPCTALTAVESSRLCELEDRIEQRAARYWIEQGNDLQEIRDCRLYRETHDTFESYCRERWNISRIHAHRLIEGAEVAGLLPIGNAPETESQARELTPVPKSDVQQVWEKAVETAPNGKITASHIRNVVREHKGLPPLPTPKKAREIARREGRSVEATDGYLYDGRTEEELAAEQKIIDLKFKLFDGLEELASIPVPPEELVELIPTYQYFRVNKDLDSAVEFLAVFNDLWREKERTNVE